MRKHLLPVLIATALTFGISQPASANNPFRGLFSGLQRTILGVPQGILNTVISNPVGTFEILRNEGVIKLGPRAAAQADRYIDLYNRYGRYLPVIGRSALPPTLVVEEALRQAGVDTGIPRSLEDIIDLARGRRDGETAVNADDDTCFSLRPDGCQFTELHEELLANLAEQETGALGRLDPLIVRRFNREVALRGLQPDRLITNPIPASISQSNAFDRGQAQTEVSTVLSQSGQENSAAQIEAVYAALEGIHDTATSAGESRVSQDKLQAIMFILAQQQGWEARKAVADETQKSMDAMNLQMQINNSRSLDGMERRMTFNHSFNAANAARNSRRFTF